MRRELNPSSRITRWAALVAASLATLGCGHRVNPASAGLDCDAQTGFCFPRDGGQDVVDGADASDGDSAETPPTGGTIVIVSPSSPTYTKGSVSVSVQVTQDGGQPDQVEVLKDGLPFRTLTSALTFEWDTSGDAEGPHELVARATLGGVVVSSQPVTVVVDRTPPMVKADSRVPAPGATEVALADPIVVQFSEPILPSTAAGALALSQTSGPVATTAALDAAGTKLTVAIKDRMAVKLDAATPAMLTATISSGVTDLAGNALMNPPQWSWTAPLWLDFGSVKGESARLALDATGNPYVSTVFEPGAIGSTVYNIQVSKHLQAKSWDTTSIPSPQTSGSSISFGSTSLILDVAGKPILAWSEAPTAGDTASVHVAHWSGAAWESRGIIDQVSGDRTHAFNPWLARDAQDVLFVAWSEYGTNNVTDVYVSRWTGTAWSLLAPIGVIGASSPVMLLGSDGKPMVGWIGGISTNGISKWTGAAWDTKNYPASYSSNLALTKAQRPVVAFPSGDTIRVSYADVTNEEFSTAISAGSQPVSPYIVIDASDRLVLAWVSYDGFGRNMQVARWTGTEWDRSYGSLNAVAAQSSDAGAPSVALDGSGVPVVTWQEPDVRKTTYVRKNNR
jgi:hypothetical protein